MRSPVATAFMARQPANQVSLPLYGRIAAGLPIEATRLPVRSMSRFMEGLKAMIMG